MKLDFKKGLGYGMALGTLFFFSSKPFFAQDYRKYSVQANGAPSAEGSGAANDAKIQALSQLKDPIVHVKPEDLDGKPLVDFSLLACFNYDYPDEDGGAKNSQKFQKEEAGHSRFGFGVKWDLRGHSGFHDSHGSG